MTRIESNDKITLVFVRVGYVLYKIIRYVMK